MGKMPNWFILRAKTTIDFARKNYQTGMIPMGKLHDSHGKTPRKELSHGWAILTFILSNIQTFVSPKPNLNNYCCKGHLISKVLRHQIKDTYLFRFSTEFFPHRNKPSSQ